MGNPEKPGEFGLIERYFKPLAKTPAARTLADDAAVLAPAGGRETVITTDTLIEGVHFPAGEAGERVAARLLAVNLSDLAAMGAEPCAYTLSLALPADWRDDWMQAFADGLGRAQDTHDIDLVGGDTVATPGPMTLTVTAIGLVEAGKALGRGGAKPGDRIYVSGTIGDAALGLRIIQGRPTGLSDAEGEPLVRRFQGPEPRVRLGRRLIGLAHAAIDVSDGLVADLGHLARASGMDAVLEADAVPLSDAASAAVARTPDMRAVVLTGGDDYELLFTAAPEAAAEIDALAGELGLPLTAVGRIGNADGAAGEVRVVDADDRPVAVGDGGYRHF